MKCNHIFSRIVILVIFWWIGHRPVSGSFHKSRTWHEELVVKVSHTRKQESLRVLYPNYKTCVAPKERPEKVSKSEQGQSANQFEVEESWPSLMSIFNSHAGYEIYSWKRFTKNRKVQGPTLSDQLAGMLLFVTAFFLLFMIFTCFIPVVGCFLFTFCNLAWSLIFHAEIRRICRRIYITKEKMYNCMKAVLPRRDRKGKGKKQFRLPYILREYPEEEIPAELIFSGDEESEGEHSSDGFEDLIIASKGREAKAAKKDNLVKLMATTEKELSKDASIKSTTSIATRK